MPPLPRRLRAADHTKSGATSSNVPLVRRSSAQDTSSSPELCEEDTTSSEGSGVSTDDKTGVAIRRMGELRAKLMTAMTKRTKEACSQVPFLSYCNGPWPPPPQYARMSPELMCQVVEQCHPHLKGGHHTPGPSSNKGESITACMLLSALRPAIPAVQAHTSQP